MMSESDVFDWSFESAFNTELKCGECCAAGAPG